MKKKQLTDNEQDILDGIKIPSLQEYIIPDADKGLKEKQLPHDTSISDSAAESLDSSAIIDAIKQMFYAQKEFDPLTNEKSVKNGAISRSKNQLNENETRIIIAHVRERIKSIREKATKLKDAVTERQNVSPTVVAFDQKQNTLLKRGMVRIFGHKANTITFDHYRAALEARHALAEAGLEEQIQPLDRILNK